MRSQSCITQAVLATVVLAVYGQAAPSNTSQHRVQTETETAQAQGTAQASARLMKELVETFKCDSYKNGLFNVELINDNLYEWEVRLLYPDPEHALHKDLKRLRELGKRDYVQLRITFPPNYPNELPFVRTVYPVMLGRDTGAFCMYLLSPQGWIPDCTVESLILTLIGHMDQFRYTVDFDLYQSEYSDEKSERDRWHFTQMHDWNKPRPKDHTWYDGPNVKN